MKIYSYLCGQIDHKSMPKDKKDLPKKQAKRGNLPLPVDVIDELREWKRAYEIAWSDPAPDGKQYNMTYEQLIRRLLEGVKRLDPEVWAEHEAARKTREEQEEMMADFRKSFWSELKSTKAKLDGFYEEMMREIAAEGDSPAPAQEGVKEEERVKEELGTAKEKRTEKRYVHPDGRWFRVEMHPNMLVPVDPITNQRSNVKTLKEQGFKLMDVEV